MLSLVQLRTLIEVVRRGSLAAAANRLGYTSSAVSQQMAALERDTGVTLFIRSGRSITPTPAARMMAAGAERLLHDADELVALAGASAPHARQLRVGAFPSAATHLLPRMLTDPAWASEGIDLTVVVGEPSSLAPGLRTGGDLDVAVVYQVGAVGLELPHGISREWLFDDPYAVLVPAATGYREQETVPLEDLRRFAWIHHVRDSGDATHVAAVLAEAGLHPRVAGYSDDANATMAMVAAGAGVAFLPRLSLRGRPAESRVVHVPQLNLCRQIGTLTARDAAGHAATFCAAVRRALAAEAAI